MVELTGGRSVDSWGEGPTLLYQKEEKRGGRFTNLGVIEVTL